MCMNKAGSFFGKPTLHNLPSTIFFRNRSLYNRELGKKNLHKFPSDPTLEQLCTVEHIASH